MKRIFDNLSLAYAAEHIKLRGTGFYIMSAAFGIITPLIYFLVLINLKELDAQSLPYSYYFDSFKAVLQPFAGFFLPVLIIILTSRIAQFDHKNGGWQLMETQPLNKASIYFSKYLVIVTACIFSITGLFAASFLMSWLVTFVHEVPEMATLSVDFTTLTGIFFRLLLASLFAISLQYAIAVLMPSFIWSILIGFAGLLSFYFLSPFKLAPDWHPYEIISSVYTYPMGSDLGYWFTYKEVVGLLFSVIILYLGFQWYAARKLSRAYTRTMRVLLLSVSIVVVLFSLIVYLLIPKTMQGNSRTVLIGEIESDIPLKFVYVQSVIDTLAIIPIQDKKFSYLFPQEILFDKYNVTFDNAFQVPVLFGKSDSVYTRVRYYNNQPELNIYGTRIAENKQVQEQSWGSVAQYWVENNLYLDRPDFVADRLYDEWDDQMKKLRVIKTVDNFIPKDDFKNRKKTIISARYMNFWNTYQAKRAVVFDSVESQEPKKIAIMRKEIRMDDETLLIEPEYTEFVLHALISKEEEEISQEQRQLRAIAKLEASSFKDKSLFFVLSRAVGTASSRQEINDLIQTFAHQFQNSKYRRILLAKASARGRLLRNEPAPDFSTSNLTNDTITLQGLGGKLTVIDVWATWCGPCKTQSPYFEKIAIKYKNYPVQFVALSVDRKKMSWVIDAKRKSSAVVQLHINDIDSFSADYAIETIPRYILLDANRRILNADMPNPTDDNFEVILKNELGLK